MKWLHWKQVSNNKYIFVEPWSTYSILVLMIFTESKKIRLLCISFSSESAVWLWIRVIVLVWLRAVEIGRLRLELEHSPHTYSRDRSSTGTWWILLCLHRGQRSTTTGGEGRVSTLSIYRGQFPTNKSSPKTGPWWRDMRCLSWVQSLVNISVVYCVQYYFLLGRYIWTVYRAC